jgi:GrpB-like predicted nucleotidyltransferase (UPF0157 family)
MTLAIHDSQAATLDADEARRPVDVLAPRHYQERAIAAFEDMQLLLSAILPDARVEHIGASSIPGAYSKGDVDLCAAVPQGGFHEALGVLGEAGFTIRVGTPRTEHLCLLDAPAGDIPLAVQLIESASRFESFVAFRDALRADPTLLARYNAIKIEAGPLGEAAYRGAKDEFIRGVLAMRGRNS